MKSATGLFIVGVSIMLFLVAVIGTFTGSYTITTGRVTFIVHGKLIQNPSLILLVATVLVISSTTFFLRRCVVNVITAILLSLIATSLYLIGYVVLLTVLYIVVLILTITVMVKTVNDTYHVVKGVIYPIVLIETMCLTYYITLLLGYKAEFLSSVAIFKAVLWSSLWFITPVATCLSSIIFFLRLITQLLRKNANFIQSPYAPVTSRPSRRTLLLLGVIFSIVIGFIGYIPTVNPSLKPVNTDWIYYYSALLKLSNTSNIFIEALRSWQGGDRPLYVLLLYSAWKLTGVDLKALCIYHNLLFLPLYTISMYFMAKRIYGEHEWVYLVPLIASLSPQLMSFIYGGYQADLFTLSLIFIAVGLIASKKPAHMPLIPVLSCITVLLHRWVWTLYSAIILTMGAVATIRFIKKKERAYMMVMLSSSLFILTGRLILYIVSSIYPELYTPENLIGLAILSLFKAKTAFDKYLDNIWFYHVIYTGGSLNNPLYSLLFLMASYINVEKFYASILVYTPLVASFLLFALPTAVPAEYTYAYRVLLDIPTAMIVAQVFNGRLKCRDKFVLILCLTSYAMGFVLSIIPGS